MGKKIPSPPGLEDWIGVSRALHWTLYGGEDFELILTMAAPSAELWLAALKKTEHVLKLTESRQPRQIGVITEPKTVSLCFPDGAQQSLALSAGFQHFTH